MPKRPRTHKNEDFSRNRLRDMFTQCGWVVWDLYPDYGEDLLVRIFINETATPYSFFVQAKSTINIDKYMHRDGKHMSFPIDVDHLAHWKRFWEPVILTLWDAGSDVTYWEIVQDFLERERINEFLRKKISVKIPINNVLNDESMHYIYERTRERFERFELAREGIQCLVDRFQEQLGVKISYQIGEESLSIKYPSGNLEIALFGNTKQRLRYLASEYGVLEEEFVIGLIRSKGLERGLLTKEVTENGGVILHFMGNIVESFETLDEFNAKYDKFHE